MTSHHAPPPATSGPDPHRLSRNVVVLSWVSFFQDAGSEMLYPVMPLFITGVLGAPASVVGIIEGIAEGTASLMKAVSGRLADRHRRRPMIAAGYGLSSVAKLLIGVATGWPLVLAARFGDRAGKGLRTSPRDAIIADDTPPALRGRAFGFHRAADTAGAVLGPLSGLALYEALDHRIRPLFFCAFIPAAVSVGLIALVRESPGRPLRGTPVAAVTTDLPGLPPPYRRVVAFLTLFGLVNFPDALLILRARNLGLDFAGVVLAYALYNTVYAGLSYPSGRLSDRVPPRYIYAAGMVVFAIAYAGLGVVTSSAWIWILLPLYGGYTALTDGVGKAWVAGMLPPGRSGSGLGVYQAITGGSAVFAGVWAGLLWGSDGRLPLVLSGGVAGVLGVILMVGGTRQERPGAGSRTGTDQ